MPAESISAKRRPGFPKEKVGESEYRADIEYVGLESDLRTAAPSIGSAWGDYQGTVSEVSIEPLELTGYAILTVSVVKKFEPEGDGTGEKQETNYEIDWVDVQRPIFEHREFMAGGAYALTNDDIIEIGIWKENPNAEKKKAFLYENTPGSADWIPLSDPAKRCAAGILKGIEYFVFKAPIARKSETWVNGPPNVSEAGLKDTPTGFPHLPSGFEWIKSADRSIRSGAQNRWQRDEEWQGADKVLIDAEGIFWPAP